MRPPLTTSMTVPVTGSPLSKAPSMRFHAFSNLARFLLRMRRPSASSLVMTRASISSSSSDFLGGVDVLADAQLVDRDDALGLVADVDEDLVLVDAHDLAGDDVALAEVGQRHVVVGDDLAVHLDEVALAALDDPGVVRCGDLWVDWFLCHVVS